MSDIPAGQDLDLSFLYEIADGSNEFIVESIDMLLAQAPELLGEIGAGIRSADWATAAGAAHKLKPSMGFFGMLISQELLQEIEQRCKAGGNEPAVIADKYSQVKDLIETNMRSLEAIKAKL